MSAREEHAVVLCADRLPEALRAAGLDPDEVLGVIDRALGEDLALGPDVTTEAVLPASAVGSASVVARGSGVLAGVPVAAAVVHRLAERQGAAVTVEALAADGSRVDPGRSVLRARAPLRCLLTAERTMLNLLGQLSGVATATAAWVDALRGTGTTVRDTRKTVPGLRSLQKYAVRCGGGQNHRMGLGDAALIKDNHIMAAGSLTAAVEAVRALAPRLPCEVECDTLEQVREAVRAGSRLVLLDNMAPPLLAEAVALCRPAGVRTEASGGLTLADARAVAATGVDHVSVGALTHSAPVLDLGLDLEWARTSGAGQDPPAPEGPAQQPTRRVAR